MVRSRLLANGLVVSALVALSMVVAVVPTHGAVGAHPARVVGAGLDYSPPAESPFVDVLTDHQFYTEIAWLA
ncbi:MAG: hypothetical protein EOL89_05380, partial [Actinobacteria bacterium]|nr:hypothetical protein [Actinomycetota bacterium]